MLKKIWVLALVGILSVASIHAQDEVEESSVSFKVHIFWEGHKILWNLHCGFEPLLHKTNLEILQKFVAFLEYMTFTKGKKI